MIKTLQNNIKNHVKNNSGDLYIQMIVCLLGIVLIFAFSFNVISVMTQKTWIDDKLNDITRIVAVTGSTKLVDEIGQPTEIGKIVAEIKDRMGEDGNVTFKCEEESDWFNKDAGLVQLNGIVTVTYEHKNYPAITIMNIDIPIDINIKKLAISEKYYKPS